MENGDITNFVGEFINELETEKIVNYEIKSGNRTITKSDKPGHELDYAIYYSGLSDFKRSYFKCSLVEYNTESGRIKAMYFEQLES